MNLGAVFGFVAAFLCGIVALAVLFRRDRGLAGYCFSAGMLVFAVESAFTGVSFLASSATAVVFWQTLMLLARSFLPGIWICFSLVYARANYREVLLQSRTLLAAAFLIPLLVLTVLHSALLNAVAYPPPAHDWRLRFGGTAKVLDVVLLVSTIAILMNLERTFRSAVGTMRWRIKFPVIGLAVIFGTRIYTRSQALLFSGYDLSQQSLETSALLIGCAVIAVAYFRKGIGTVDVYPSRAVLQTSITLLLAGGYLFVVGVLAQVVAHFGGISTFPFAAFVVLLGIAFLGLVVFSDRMRQSMQLFVSRHFKRPQHDFREMWTRFTRSMSMVLDESRLCATACRQISETFGALSVSIWLLDEQQRLVRKNSTADAEDEMGRRAEAIQLDERNPIGNGGVLARPFDIEKAKEKWAANLREKCSSRFLTGGSRLCVPLVTGEHWLGAIVLADRVRGLHYTGEEIDLLQCVGNQVAASLLNLRLTKELMEKKELEAFQTISAFFVHDLKNAASTLGLMLKNLPVHFDDPAFREDALRGIGSAAGRINDLISRLNALRREMHLTKTQLDLNLIVIETLKVLNGSLGVEVVTHLNPLPAILADRGKLESVVTNLLLNARDALSGTGCITVETSMADGCVALSVSDNGCGMAPEFIEKSLFRPFRTTKKKGLGIGMFQAKMIVDAHAGTIRVKSAPGVGTAFEVSLPLNLQNQ